MGTRRLACAGRYARRVIAGLAVFLGSIAGAQAAPVTVAWDPSPDESITGYILSYGRSSGAYSTQIDVGNVTTHTLDLPADGGVYYIIVQAHRDGLRSPASNEVAAVVPLATSSRSLVTNRWKVDFAGEGYASFTTWDPHTGIWNVLRRSPSTGVSDVRSYQWGAGAFGDVPVSGDYDGDGRSDIAVWRPTNGVWFIRLSTTNYATDLTVQWGAGSQGDVPVPGDYDGDGRTDIAVWRPGNGVWFVKTSSSHFQHAVSYQWGAGHLGDVPVPGDYDGDGRTDVAVWRPGPGVWFVRTSSTGYEGTTATQWGAGHLGDVPAPGDYDGDGRTDLAVWRASNGTWFVRTWTGSFGMQWGSGQVGDVPVANDYDGDGITDIAVWRPVTMTWFVRTSSSRFANSFSVRWGSPTHVPVR